MDLSPPAVVKIIIKAYFAVTAGAVMAGVRGDLNADVGIASAHAWLQLDMIFRWVPRFGFEIDLEFGIDIEVFGCSFASISFRARCRAPPRGRSRAPRPSTSGSCPPSTCTSAPTSGATRRRRSPRRPARCRSSPKR